LAFENLADKDTTLTAWFKANALHQNGDINNTLYQDFPSKMVWQQKTRTWTVRKQGFQIGRMYLDLRTPVFTHGQLYVGIQGHFCQQY
jgi:hypothetical protein